MMIARRILGRIPDTAPTYELIGKYPRHGVRGIAKDFLAVQAG